jgi:hypothetical protein
MSVSGSRTPIVASSTPAPSGIPVATTNTIIVVDTDAFAKFTGEYQKESSTLYRSSTNYDQTINFDLAEWRLYDDEGGISVFPVPPSTNINYIATTGWPTQTLTAA